MDLNDLMLMAIISIIMAGLHPVRAPGTVCRSDDNPAAYGNNAPGASYPYGGFSRGNDGNDAAGGGNKDLPCPASTDSCGTACTGIASDSIYGFDDNSDCNNCCLSQCPRSGGGD